MATFFDADDNGRLKTRDVIACLEHTRGAGKHSLWRGTKVVVVDWITDDRARPKYAGNSIVDAVVVTQLEVGCHCCALGPVVASFYFRPADTDLAGDIDVTAQCRSCGKRKTVNDGCQ
jgi:hypothetical protein